MPKPSLTSLILVSLLQMDMGSIAVAHLGLEKAPYTAEEGAERIINLVSRSFKYTPSSLQSSNLSRSKTLAARIARDSFQKPLEGTR